MEQLVDDVVEFEDDVGQPEFWVIVEREKGANAWTIPGITVPMDPRTVRRIRVDTRAVLAICLLRRPGVQRDTYPASDKIMP